MLNVFIIIAIGFTLILLLVAIEDYLRSKKILQFQQMNIEERRKNEEHKENAIIKKYGYGTSNYYKYTGKSRRRNKKQ